MILDRQVTELQREWQLDVDGPVTRGRTSVVVPVRTVSGGPAALKVSPPDEGCEQEALALQHWHGDGAALLLRADPHRRALLLERLHPESLTELGDLEACELVAERYGRLHVAAPPRLRRLSAQLDRWRGQLAELPRNAPVPRRLVEQSLAILGAFSSDDRTDGTLVHGDLGYDNVLAGGREPWLVVDPEPLNGDPHFEPAPMLWGRWEEVVASGDARSAVRRRFHTLVDTAGLDEDRARDWAVLRAVLEAVRGCGKAGRDADRTTRCVTVAKAVQE